jgi:hypothetical protein
MPLKSIASEIDRYFLILPEHDLTSTLRYTKVILEYVCREIKHQNPHHELIGILKLYLIALKKWTDEVEQDDAEFKALLAQIHTDLKRIKTLVVI